MTINRLLRAGVLALGAAVTAGCVDVPSAPPLRPGAANLERVDPSVIATGITRDVPLQRDVTASFKVPKSGGIFEVPGTGLRMIVPGGALRGSGLTITVTAHAGPMVAYTFEPHGTVFALPILMTQDVAGTSYTRLSNKAGVEVGYFADRSHVNVTDNQALVSEFLPALPDWTGNQLRFQVHHFSGYMMSSGRNFLE